MFLAKRDLSFAKGRFGLMAGVIGLLSLLIVLLSGLTAGLSNQSVASVVSLPANELAFSRPAAGESVSFANSTVSEAQVRSWAHQHGIAGAEALGIAPAQVTVGSARVAVSAFGAPPGTWLAPSGLAANHDGVVISADLAAKYHLHAGQSLAMNGHRYPVAGTAANAWFDHTPVVWLPLSSWHRLPSAYGSYATVVGLRTTPGASLAAGNEAAHTETTSLQGAQSTIGSFSAENGSLTLMRVLLFVVSALVAGAFFTVWTVQRRGDLAVLKAIGATDGYLVRDALSQAAAVLVVGGAAGATLATGFGFVVARIMPFFVTPATTVVPLLVLVGVGLVGAVVAVRSITSVDPLTALGAAR